MNKLIFDAKWVVLDADNAEAADTDSLLSHLRDLSEDDAIVYVKANLSAEVEGDMKAVSGLNVYVGALGPLETTVELKHLSFVWESEHSVEGYGEEYGEAVYMELEHGDTCIPFMAYEGFGISDKQ